MSSVSNLRAQSAAALLLPRRVAAAGDTRTPLRAL